MSNPSSTDIALEEIKERGRHGIVAFAYTAIWKIGHGFAIFQMAV